MWVRFPPGTITSEKTIFIGKIALFRAFPPCDSFRPKKTHCDAFFLVNMATIWQQSHRMKRKVRVHKYADSNRPHLKFVVNYREAGKRKRSFFETKEQADSFAAFKNAELKRNGVEGAEFPTALRIMAQDAMEALKPFGKTIKDAADFLVVHLKASERSCTAAQLVKELLKAKEADGVSLHHLRDLRYRLSVFAKTFDGKPVAPSPPPRLTTGCAHCPSRRSHGITIGNASRSRSTSRCGVDTRPVIQQRARPKRRWSANRRAFSQ